MTAAPPPFTSEQEARIRDIAAHLSQHAISAAARSTRLKLGSDKRATRDLPESTSGPVQTLRRLGGRHAIDVRLPVTQSRGTAPMSSSFYSDFRASIAPSTARERHRHFKARLDAFLIEDENAERIGAAAPEYDAARSGYERLLRAHVAFADAQVQQLGRAAAASSKEVEKIIAGARPALFEVTKPSISLDLHALPDGISAQVLVDGEPAGDRVFMATPRRRSWWSWPSWRDARRSER